MGERAGCCRCCFSFIFSIGLTALFIWLTLRPDKPHASVQSFYLPALNRTLNSKRNTSLDFMVQLDNPNKDKGIYYDDVRLTFVDSRRNRSIANYTIPRFYQGHKKKAKKRNLTSTDAGAVLMAAYPNGTAYFRVRLETAVRFKILFWRTKRYKLNVAGEVEVNGNGTKVKKKGVKLKSLAAASKSESFSLMMSILVTTLVFAFLS